MAKRIFDVLAAAVGLLLLAPLLAVLAVCVRCSSPGPVFYRGIRAGRHGKLFRMLKFRTMVVDAERFGGSCTSENDPRITAVGHRLRRYKLDELPQLVNVLIGEMSLVGPRPEVEKYVRRLSKRQRRILNVRPGITDWATLWDHDEGAILSGSSDPERTYLEKVWPEKVRLQLQYVDKRTFWMDLRILISTFALVVQHFFMHRPQPQPDLVRSSSK